MKEQDLFTRCDNAMVHLLSPEELLGFAEADRIEKESEATIAELFEKVRARNLTNWQDNQSAEELDILEQLPAEDREFYARAYPEDLKQLAAAESALGQAKKSKAKYYRIAAKRA